VEKAGGWGQLLGDRGGGYDLAMQGLRLVLTHYDLNQKITPLAEEILRTLGLNRLSDLVGWAMQAEKMDVARLAPAIFHAAKYGEPEMLLTVQAGATVLAEYTRAVAQRLAFPRPRVQLMGGLFTHHEDYVSLYKYRLSILLPDAQVEVCRVSGALGAAWLAARPESGDRKPESFELAASPKDSSLSGLRSPISGLDESDLSDLAAAATEQSNPRSAGLDQRTTREVVELFIAEEDYVPQALASCREPLIAAIDLTSAALAVGGRLFYVGAGTRISARRARSRCWSGGRARATWCAGSPRADARRLSSARWSGRTRSARGRSSSHAIPRAGVPRARDRRGTWRFICPRARRSSRAPRD
jgi:N-acetylmuramic acid 6-phosphate etherase